MREHLFTQGYRLKGLCRAVALRDLGQEVKQPDLRMSAV